MKATAFAPATVANVAVGFDLFGFAIDGVGDRVCVSRLETPGQVLVTAIESAFDPDLKLPRRAEENTATAGLLAMLKDLALPFGFSVAIEKGIPIGSGLGGSASSAVAAVVAANALLEHPLPTMDLLRYCAVGEQVASGSIHGDNIAPSLLGGLCFVRSMDPVDVVRIPVPSGLFAAVVLPRLRVDTRDARALLSETVPRRLWVEQSACLSGTLLGLFLGDVELLRRSFRDVVIEPQRARLITGFEQVKSAALSSGAIGCSISGSGPCVFAWAETLGEATAISLAMESAFVAAGVSVFGRWVSSLNVEGAKVVA